MNTITRIDYAAARERLARASCVGSVAMQAVRPICVELHHFGRDRQRSSYVAFWHTTDVQRLPVLGPLSGALPTFGAECLVTGAFQTLRQAVLKVGS